MPTSPNSFANLGANVTLAVKAGRTVVFSLSCDNANAADRYLQLHNLATVPTGGEAPVEAWRVPTGSTIIVGTDYFTDAGIVFALGCMFAFSTTRDTYTAGSASDQATRIKYA